MFIFLDAYSNKKPTDPMASSDVAKQMRLIESFFAFKIIEIFCMSRKRHVIYL